MIEEIARDLIALHDRWIGPLWPKAFDDAKAGRWGAVSAENYVARASAWLIRAQRVTQAGVSNPSPVIDELGALMDKVIWAKNYLVSRGYGLQSIASAVGSGVLAGLEEGLERIDVFFSAAGGAVQDVAESARGYAKYVVPALVFVLLIWLFTNK